MKKLITVCFQLLFRFLSQMFPSQLWWLRSDRFELESCQLKIAAPTLSNSLTSFIIPGPPVQNKQSPPMTRHMALSHIFQCKQSAQGGNTLFCSQPKKMGVVLEKRHTKGRGSPPSKHQGHHSHLQGVWSFQTPCSTLQDPLWIYSVR